MAWIDNQDTTNSGWALRPEGAGTKYYFLRCYDDEEISEELIEQTRIENGCDRVQVIRKVRPIFNRFEILDL